MSYQAGFVVANETCSCGAHIEVASGTGWLDASNVQAQLRAWRAEHQHTTDSDKDREET